MPFQNVVEILLYIVPGFLALQIYRARAPIKRHSDFYDIASSIVFSVPVVVLIRWLDLRALGGSLHTSASFPYMRYVLVLLGTGIVGGLLLIAIHEIRFRLPQKWPALYMLAPDPQSIWARLNQPWNQDWAIVFLDDGAIYRGWISEYTFDPDQESQDFLLSDATRVDENLKELYAIKGTGVYLNTRNVRRIEFIAGE